MDWMDSQSIPLKNGSADDSSSDTLIICFKMDHYAK